MPAWVRGVITAGPVGDITVIQACAGEAWYWAQPWKTYSHPTQRADEPVHHPLARAATRADTTSCSNSVFFPSKYNRLSIIIGLGVECLRAALPYTFVVNINGQGRNAANRQTIRSIGCPLTPYLKVPKFPKLRWDRGPRAPPLHCNPIPLLQRGKYSQSDPRLRLCSSLYVN